jgi:maltooligosyltrehalose trehalohydrolase
MAIGAKYLGKDRCCFTVWAPEKKKMTLHIVHPAQQKIQMQKDETGHFTAEVQTPVGTRYLYINDDAEKGLPDPAAHYQPGGVHGPSEVIDQNAYKWNDSNWKPPVFEDLILYELHIGTFTGQGTFESAIEKLDLLVEIGINAIEIMPVAQFPGDRNWGYDGVYPYAVQNSYGGPLGLKKLVDACHQRGIAVFLDVVYNHQGPEGNYIEQFAPYFTDHYKTPWGKAINYDGQWSDGVREFYSGNAIYWLEDFHIDGLRFDAVHAVYDFGAVHFWELVHEKIRELEKKNKRAYYTIAESDLNAPHVIQPVEQNGYGFTAQWLDDFHHAAYVLLDKDGKDRYYDFGTMHQLAKAYCEGFVHSGEFVKFRKRKYGRSSAGIPGNKFVAFINNHDQAGNRMDGARLCSLVGLDLSKIATAMLLLAPYVPMLFMGEEYGEESPFYYFISHSDPVLIKSVREGRKEEFKAFVKPGIEFPDPQSEYIFRQSKLNWEHRNNKRNKILLEWHAELIRLRKTNDALKHFDKECIRAEVLQQDGIVLHRKDHTGRCEVLALFNISSNDVAYFLPGNNGSWKKLLDSTEGKWLQENTSTNKAGFPALAQAGVQVKIPAKAVIVLGKEID